jgi:hypothetical protein
MNGRSRIARIALVAALVGVAAMTASAYAAQDKGSTSVAQDTRQPDTSAVPQVRGYEDFGLSYTPPAVVRTGRKIASRDTRQPDTSAVPRVRGYEDFGLSYTAPAIVRTARHVTSQPLGEARSGDFDWADAGVGAAAMLGLALLAGGLGAAVVVRGRRGEYRSA